MWLRVFVCVLALGGFSDASFYLVFYILGGGSFD